MPELGFVFVDKSKVGRTQEENVKITWYYSHSTQDGDIYVDREPPPNTQQRLMKKEDVEYYESLKKKDA